MLQQEQQQEQLLIVHLQDLVHNQELFLQHDQEHQRRNQEVVRVLMRAQELLVQQLVYDQRHVLQDLQELQQRVRQLVRVQACDHQVDQVVCVRQVDLRADQQA